MATLLTVCRVYSSGYNFTPKFKSTGRATLYTILIDRPTVYLTRASGLYTNSQTGHMSTYNRTSKSSLQLYRYTQKNEVRYVFEASNDSADAVFNLMLTNLNCEVLLRWRLS